MADSGSARLRVNREWGRLPCGNCQAAGAQAKALIFDEGLALLRYTLGVGHQVGSVGPRNLSAYSPAMPGVRCCRSATLHPPG